MPDYSILLPAFNEAKRITRTLEHIAAFASEKAWHAEVLVIDDGSVDATAAVVEGIASRHPLVRLIRLPRNRGKGHAIRVGVMEAQGKFILFADADDSTPIADAEKLFGALAEGADIAIGSRWVDPSLQLQPQPLHRLLNGRFYNLLMRRVLGLRFKDTQNGFKAYRASAAKAIFPLQRIGGWGFDAEVLYLARKFRFTVSEIPVEYTYFAEGSKIRPYRDGARMVAELLRVKWLDWIGAYPGEPPLRTASATGSAGMADPRYLVILGTRPEAIKLAPLLKAFAARGLPTVVCATGQHEQLVPPILRLFGITPDYRLRTMSSGQEPSALIAHLLPQLGALIEKERPGRVLVQGDTTSALAGALAACYAGIPVAHVEAGIRSGNSREPFPEELNRRMIDAIADVHFAPTAHNREALLREGCDAGQVFTTGNTGIDAMYHVLSLPFTTAGTSLAELPSGKKTILVTLHRRENHGAPLISICETLCALAERWSGSAHFVLPVHPNPQVSATVHERLGGVAGFTLMPPLEYPEMIALAQACHFAMVDSGGLQEELPHLGKPALILRNVTDRPEATLAGAAMLVGSEKDSIISAFTRLMEDTHLYREMAQPRDLYGDGKAAERIVSLLASR